MIRTWRGGLILVLLAVLAAACSAGRSSDSGYGSSAATQSPGSPTGPAQETPATVAAARSSLGLTLVDAEGRTLYALTKDKGGQSSCYGDCAAAWPALTVQTDPAAGRGVEASLLATVHRNGGSTQVTYKGWPLYRFSGDQQPGDTNGQGVSGVWFVVGSDGSLVRSTADRGTDSGYQDDSGYP